MKKVGQQEVEIVLNGVRCLSCMQMKVTAQEEYIHEEVLNEKPLKRNKSAERELQSSRWCTSVYLHMKTTFIPRRIML